MFQSFLSEKMERYIFNNDLSLNPSCKPYSLSEKTTYPLIEFSEYIFKNDDSHAITIQIDAEAAETGETISVISEIGSVLNLKSRSFPKDWEATERTVIGDTQFSS